MKTIRQIINILLMGAFPFVSFCQFNKFENSDSFFKLYKPPVIEKEVYNQLEKDNAIVYIGCYFTTDTAGKVTSQKFVPFQDVGNKYQTSDSIWRAVISSLAAASQNWVFKPILWEFKKDKVSEEKLNKRAFQRPFAGRPNYLIIFEVSGINGSVIQKIGFENYFEIRQE